VLLCTGLAGVIRCLYEALEGVRRLSVCLAALHSVFPAANSQQPTPPPTIYRHPSPAITEDTASQHPHRAAYRHGKRVAKRPTFLPVSRNCLCPPDPRLCCSTVPKSCPVLSPSRLRAVFCHQPPTASDARLLSLTAPISWPAGATEKHLLLGSISCLLQSSLATRSSSAILVFSPHRNPGACVAIPHLACSRQDSDVIPHKLDRYRYHPRRIFRNHGGHCNRFAHRGVCPDERPSERPDLTESHTIVDVGRLAQKFDQRCTCIHVGNTTQQWRRS
jgi:hypothetical protein